jgi:hypothetical protein
MSTGENEQGLRKILDLTRLISMVVLLLHFYYECYGLFRHWDIRSEATDHLLRNVQQTGLFTSFNKAKIISLLFLCISLLGVQGRKNKKAELRTGLVFIGTGMTLYFGSASILDVGFAFKTRALLYMSFACTGFLLVISGGTGLTRIVRQKIGGDVFNTLQETFPQEERLLFNEYSINLPAQYNLKGNLRRSWINIINPFRGLLVMGSPGSGKSYFVIQHILRQHIEKGFSLFVYDFKFDDLTRIAYNQYLAHRHRYRIIPQFFLINFDDLARSHRCNPLAPATMHDITDAAESSRTILLGLNREWIRKSGDFFVESPINFVTALIWFLRCYKKGRYCTLPHVIELAQVEYEKLFSILRTNPEIEALINPFVSAFLHGANEQLEGQIASAKISLSRLSSDKLYYILSGHDFTLDINDPAAPKIVCMGSNPQKSSTYGAVLSLYTTALTRVINQKNGHPSSLVFDEFPTLYFHGIDHLIATARSNRIATTLAVQDASQLKLHYGRDQAEVILNITGNVISGQVSGETAKSLSERFGKILQERESLSINRHDTSFTQSRQLEMAIPASKIASLSSGEFVGMVADNPEQPITLKAFCARVIQDHTTLRKEENTYQPLPVVRDLHESEVTQTYQQIKRDIESLVALELERMLDTPSLSDLLVRRE